jgi:hypothetical protein
METVRIASGKVVSLLGDGVTATGAGDTRYKDSPWSFFQAIVTGSGAVTATVDIEASNDGVNWCKTPIASLALTGTDTDTDGITYVGPAKYIRANVSALTGTGATVTCSMGV